MHQSSHCVTLFRVILKTTLALYNQLSQVILRTRFMQTLHNKIFNLHRLNHLQLLK
ncbi:hypothetical protein NP493_2109g00003 [Ridgeia piscesae]|uniref:Uncharacterized protein n=1 Tax=Ridgeia piscesae TaxID=27915 RepID=A0AAD9N4W1_RIDPI|nr:hypothetical protein NP493_2109g00003 [Ridgeia piscesae]